VAGSGFFGAGALGGAGGAAGPVVGGGTVVAGVPGVAGAAGANGTDADGLAGLNAAPGVPGAFGGPITITNAGQIRATGNGVRAIGLDPGSPVLVTNSNSLIGGTIGVYSETNTSTTINNSGFLTANSLFAIETIGASTVINNTGEIKGFVDLTNNADTFNNKSGGLFNAYLTSFFGAGNDVFQNEGTVRTAHNGAASELVTFTGLEFFNNGALITMVDGAEGDLFVLSGDYAGWGLSAQLAVDAFLGGPGSTSDVLNIQGNASGATGVVVNDTHPGPGAFNNVGIPVVIVNGTRSPSNFFLAGGPIDKGFFSYDLFLNGNTFALFSAPNGSANILPRIVTASQTLWQRSSGVWFDRSADLRSYFYEGGGSENPLGPGVWVRTFGDFTQTDAQVITHQFSATRIFDVGYDQRSVGVEAGFDFPVAMSDQTVVLLGVTAGYVGSKVDFNDDRNDATLIGPNVGAYATLLHGGLFVDLLFKADLLEMRYTNAVLGRHTADVNTWGGHLDIGYRFAGASGWFMEPLGTLTYVKNDFTDLVVPGSLVRFDDNDSFMGRLGLRVGQTLHYGSYNLEPSITISVWHEMSSDNTAALTSSGTTFVFTDRTMDKTYAEVSTQLNLFNLNNKVTGFAKADMRYGTDDLFGVTGKLGVRYSW
jgi:outer membrane autotransporter protein